MAMRAKHATRIVQLLGAIGHGHGGAYPGCEYTAAELAFLRAVEAYQRRTRRKFLRHTEYLAVALSMGYRLTSAPPPPAAPS